MRVIRGLPRRPLGLERAVVAVGIFDGVHRGHQAILRRTVRRAKAIRGLPAAVTFHPHPCAVLSPARVPPMLLSLEDRLKAFGRCGIRAALVIPFTRAFSRWRPEQFIERLLLGALQAREVVVGHDFKFGAGRRGTVETLIQAGRRAGFAVHVTAPVRVAGERVASRRIRSAIQAGRIAQAARLLGRPVTVRGLCIRGSGRGRRLGFATANLRLESGVLPLPGVYAVSVKMSSSPSVVAEGRLQRGSDSRPRSGRGRAFRGNDAFLGMANVGFRPTFGAAPHALLEAHLFGVRRPLYGRRIEVAFHRRLRPERRFPSAEALQAQMAADARLARRFFALHSRGRMV